MPMIILAILSDAEVKIKRLDTGADDCLTKPVVLQEIPDRRSWWPIMPSCEPSAKHVAGWLG